MQEDAFAVLGIEPSFAIDGAAVERRWLMQAARLHPDRSPDAEDAARQLAIVNAARQTLLDDERRANALLVRLGGPTREADHALPDGFLMEIFELRQEIEEILASRDAARVAAVEADAAARRAGYVRSVGEMFSALPTPPTAAALRAIRRELNAWRYIERLIEQLDPEYDPQRADFA